MVLYSNFGGKKSDHILPFYIKVNSKYKPLIKGLKEVLGE